MRFVAHEVRLIAGKRIASPEYRAWQMMKNRVLNSKAYDYRFYGGRGITINPRWLKFENFLADMGRKPDSKLTLERRDNDDSYYKENCYWASRQDQARNRRKSFHKCNMALANEIRRLYATGKWYQQELASKFGLTQSHVSQITRNVCWTRE